MKLTPDPTLALNIQLLATTNVAQGALGGIDDELWQAALNRMIAHSGDTRLKIGDLITIVDFRKKRTEERLWVIDLKDRKVLFKTWVAHGGGTNGSKQGNSPTKFSNSAKTHLSCVGSFITRHTWSSNLGGVSGLAMGLTGLDSTCSNAQSRGIHFHGAKYVKPHSVGNSHGCFASPPTENEAIVKKIRHGSFVYAYGGKGWL